MRLLIIGLICLMAASSALAKNRDEVTLVRKVFTKLQPLSIKENREYCGYIGYTKDGALRAMKPVRGEVATCDFDPPDYLERIVASFHTHGSYSPNYFNEIPSTLDVLGDAREGINGYVATPGGRLWFVNGATRTVVMLCDLGCLPSDPDFVRGQDGIIEKSYTLRQLRLKMGE